MPEHERLTQIIDVLRAVAESEHPGLSALRDPLACDAGFFMDVFERRVADEIDQPLGESDITADLIRMFAYRGGSLAWIAVALFGEDRELIDPGCGSQVPKAAELLGIEGTVAEQLFLASLPEGWEFNYERMMLSGKVSCKAVAETFERFRDSGLVEWSVFRLVYRVNKYLLDRAYGGPEEGGWYYDTGEFIEEVGRAETFEAADELREALRSETSLENSRRQDVSWQGYYGFIIEEDEGVNFPGCQPVYS